MSVQHEPGAAQATVRVSAEERYAGELQALRAWDTAQSNALPPGWLRSPRAVRAFMVLASDVERRHQA